MHTQTIIDELAQRQCGIVTRAQLVRAGVPPGRIDRRLRSGLLRRIHAGVYQVGPVRALHALEMAAVLACGDGAAVSHRSASLLWLPAPSRPAGRHAPGLSISKEAAVHVTVPRDRDRGRRPGIVAHRTRRFAADETTLLDGLPLTTPARTLVDMAGLVRPSELERLLARCYRASLTNRAEMRTIIARHARRRGVHHLRRLVEADVEPAFTRSAAEQELLALVRAAALPDPVVNTHVHGFEVDFYWPAHGVIVEVDGYEFHRSERSFHGDRERDAILVAGGLRVMRITWRQLQRRRERTLVAIVRALATPPVARQRWERGE